MSKTLYFVCLFVFFLSGIHSVHTTEDVNDSYEKGLVLRQNGEWEKALQVWITGAQTLRKQHKSDLRIGVAFIELVTELKLHDYYEAACEIYLWSFQKAASVDNFESVQKEVERLSVITTKKQSNLWRTLVNNKDPLIYEEINSFWFSKDPTPSTTKNERLIEHWERIAYARDNFTKANTTAYGTDDRGVIYVKFGNPTYKRDGILGTNRASMKTMV